MADAPTAMEEIQYAGQDFIQTLRRSKDAEQIESVYIEQFFAGYSETEMKYEMKPWLRKQYPRDA